MAVNPTSRRGPRDHRHLLLRESHWWAVLPHGLVSVREPQDIWKADQRSPLPVLMSVELLKHLGKSKQATERGRVFSSDVWYGYLKKLQGEGLAALASSIQVFPRRGHRPVEDRGDAEVRPADVADQLLLCGRLRLVPMNDAPKEPSHLQPQNSIEWTPIPRSDTNSHRIVANSLHFLMQEGKKEPQTTLEA